ncbi:hypothetical protein FN846DRAFT_912470 [Sphaerosporella brunnea]|uniref:Uncharacterized protein n=1 Tax=Sphaerosporella brunnea TaxID=1250544 RepID=A0A5J5EI42_9PEZI|nr:hypothetical protein FN846DRAFT_912470 [Sphaerosporella brunnea]
MLSGPCAPLSIHRDAGSSLDKRHSSNEPDLEAPSERIDDKQETIGANAGGPLSGEMRNTANGNTNSTTMHGRLTVVYERLGPLTRRSRETGGKTWLTRKLLEPLEGAQISTKGSGHTYPLPEAEDGANTATLTTRLRDYVACWSRTAKTSAVNSPEEAINTSNLEVLATPHVFHETAKVSTADSRTRAVLFFWNTLRIHGVRVLAATVLRDMDVSNPKALRPLQGRFKDQRPQQA